MATDDERREVARRLRNIDLDDFSCYAQEYEAFCKAIGLGDYDSDWPNRLADLIEPSASATPTPLRRVTDASATVGVSQRGALLALAEEIEHKADEALDESAHSISEAVATSKLNEYTVRNGIARRIREALGVE